MFQAHTVLRIMLLSLTLGWVPVQTVQAGFSIRYTNSGFHRPHTRPGYPYRHGTRWYYDRYGKSYRHNPALYYNRFGKRYRHQFRYGQRRRDCDVIIVRPRYGQPYVLKRNCLYPPFRRHRRISGAHR